ncbi:MAG TPA: hypothetical protein VIX82_17450 [Solirubrobacteraceae bacterium]
MSTRWKPRCAALFALLATVAATFAIVGPSWALAARSLTAPEVPVMHAHPVGHTAAAPELAAVPGGGARVAVLRAP